MTLYMLTIRNDAHPAQLDMTKSRGPFVVEATDPRTARQLVSLENIALAQENTEGAFSIGIWDDEEASQCRAIDLTDRCVQALDAIREAMLAQRRSPQHLELKAASGRTAKFVWWPSAKFALGLPARLEALKISA